MFVPHPVRYEQGLCVRDASTRSFHEDMPNQEQLCAANTVQVQRHTGSGDTDMGRNASTAERSDGDDCTVGRICRIQTSISEVHTLLRYVLFRSVEMSRGYMDAAVWQRVQVVPHRMFPLP